MNRSNHGRTGRAGNPKSEIRNPKTIRRGETAEARLSQSLLTSAPTILGRVLGLGLAVVMAWGLTSTLAQGAEGREAAGSGCVLVEKEGKVEVARKGTTAFKAVAVGAALQNGDQLQTGSRSRATLRWSELSVLRVDELTSRSEE